MDSLIETNLQEIKEKNNSTYETAFKTLLILFENIIKNPSDKEKRNFKTTNKAIKERILVIPEIKDFLELIGYTENKNNKEILTYESDSLENINLSIKSIKNLLYNEMKDNNNNSNLMNNNNEIPVQIYQYDLTNGLLRTMGRNLIGKNIEGIWHTSCVVYGIEYYYQGGIQMAKPETTPFGKPYRKLNYGSTTITQKEFEKHINTLHSKFNANNYDLIKNNCNHFSDAAVYYLTGRHLQNDILRQHEQIFNGPLGPLIKNFLGGMQGGGNMGFNNNNPFGNNFGGFGGYGY